ncbi:MAG: hypothetical protein TREMPRED_003017 [Tremellales sp. Tagirdzhanova-0007]|nr:MAG: hypothetical protein TREMPRED_003017 [Tremellales sp. Tagirdzhanova-0007]
MPPLASEKRITDGTAALPWNFTREELERFPALRSRNFWLTGLPRAGLYRRAFWASTQIRQYDGNPLTADLGMSKSGDANRMAVQTSLHPISYTTFEGWTTAFLYEIDSLFLSIIGSDGRILPSGQRTGTLLWDIGYYEIGYANEDGDSDSARERRRKKRRLDESKEEEEDPLVIFPHGRYALAYEDVPIRLGRYHEEQFRAALRQQPKGGKSQSIHFTLKGGFKASPRFLDDHAFVLLLPRGKPISPSYGRDGREKKTWFIRLPRGIEGYSWGPDGEEGEAYGRSVKTGRTLKEVCAQSSTPSRLWDNEVKDFAGWGDKAENG